MTPKKNVALDAELFERISEEAQKQGVSPDELANEAAKRYLALRRLNSLQQYGQRKADEAGLSETDVPRLIEETRPNSVVGDPVTLDTNQYISGLNFPRGKPARILEMAAEGLIDVAVSDPILAEVHRILQRRFKWSSEMADEVVLTIRSFTNHVTPTETLAVVQRDPDDDRIVECAVAAGAEVLVTGDNDLLSLGTFRNIRFLNASQFLREFQPRLR